MNNPDPKSYLLVWKLREKVTRKLGGKKRMQRRGVLESLKRRRKEKQ